MKNPGMDGAKQYTWIELHDGSRRHTTADKHDSGSMPAGTKIFPPYPFVSTGAWAMDQPFQRAARTFYPSPNWSPERDERWPC